MSYVWSPHQLQFFANFEEDAGHAIGEAVPGSGKTTTAVEGARFIPSNRESLFCSFNKSIAKELRRKLPRSIDSSTISSVCHKAVTRAFGCEFDENKTKDIARQVCIDSGHSFVNRRGEVVPLGWSQVATLAKLAKSQLVDVDDVRTLEELATSYRIDDDSKTIKREVLASFAAETLRQCAEQKSVIDYSDQAWFVAHFDLRPSLYHVVVVDEVQDTDLCQQKALLSLLKKDGRLVGIGDSRQAIYGFRGADSQAMTRLKNGLEAKSLPLTTTYRCPRKVVELAQEVGPEIQARDGAPDGIIEQIEADRIVDLARPGDLVVSRTKAPVFGLCLKMLSKGIPAAVAGRDLGLNLIRLIDKFGGRTEDVPSMNRAIESWKAREVRRLGEIDRDDQVEEVIDLVSAILCFSEGQSSVTEIKERILGICSNDDPKAKVLFSTTHKAKGLERERVFVLADTYTLCSPRNYQEERNLWYVAITRSSSELYLAGQVRR